MKTIADISLTEKDRKAIKEAARLLRSRFPIDQTILYGSKATGTDTDESDIDLLVITSRPLSWRERDAITEALFDLELAHDVVISTLVVASSAWTSGHYTVLPIHNEVEQYGAAA